MCLPTAGGAVSQELPHSPMVVVQPVPHTAGSSPAARGDETHTELRGAWMSWHAAGWQRTPCKCQGSAEAFEDSKESFPKSLSIWSRCWITLRRVFYNLTESPFIRALTLGTFGNNFKYEYSKPPGVINEMHPCFQTHLMLIQPIWTPWTQSIFSEKSLKFTKNHWEPPKI